MMALMETMSFVRADNKKRDFDHVISAFRCRPSLIKRLMYGQCKISLLYGFCVMKLIEDHFADFDVKDDKLNVERWLNFSGACYNCLPPIVCRIISDQIRLDGTFRMNHLLSDGHYLRRLHEVGMLLGIKMAWLRCVKKDEATNFESFVELFAGHLSKSAQHSANYKMQVCHDKVPLAFCTSKAADDGGAEYYADICSEEPAKSIEFVCGNVVTAQFVAVLYGLKTEDWYKIHRHEEGDFNGIWRAIDVRNMLWDNVLKRFNDEYASMDAGYWYADKVGELGEVLENRLREPADCTPEIRNYIMGVHWSLEFDKEKSEYWEATNLQWKRLFSSDDDVEMVSQDSLRREEVAIELESSYEDEDDDDAEDSDVNEDDEDYDMDSTGLKLKRQKRHYKDKKILKGMFKIE